MERLSSMLEAVHTKETENHLLVLLYLMKMQTSPRLRHPGRAITLFLGLRGFIYQSRLTFLACQNGRGCNNFKALDMNEKISCVSWKENDRHLWKWKLFKSPSSPASMLRSASLSQSKTRWTRLQADLPVHVECGLPTASELRVEAVSCWGSISKAMGFRNSLLVIFPALSLETLPFTWPCVQR